MTALAPGRLVVATPQLADPNFARTVVLLLQADSDDGALGVVLNRPSGTAIGEVLPAWSDLAAEPDLVFVGGPVSPQAAICLGRARVGGPLVAAFAPVEGLPVLGTVDLDADPSTVAPALERVRLFAGYAGWSPGQLEAEVDEGAWFVLDGLPSDAVTGDPAQLWAQVLTRQGPPVAFAAGYPADPTMN